MASGQKRCYFLLILAVAIILLLPDNPVAARRIGRRATARHTVHERKTTLRAQYLNGLVDNVRKFGKKVANGVKGKIPTYFEKAKKIVKDFLKKHRLYFKSRVKKDVEKCFYEPDRFKYVLKGNDKDCQKALLGLNLDDALELLRGHVKEREQRDESADDTSDEDDKNQENPKAADIIAKQPNGNESPDSEPDIEFEGLSEKQKQEIEKLSEKHYPSLKDQTMKLFLDHNRWSPGEDLNYGFRKAPTLTVKEQVLLHVKFYKKVFDDNCQSDDCDEPEIVNFLHKLTPAMVWGMRNEAKRAWKVNKKKPLFTKQEYNFLVHKYLYAERYLQFEGSCSTDGIVPTADMCELGSNFLGIKKKDQFGYESFEKIDDHNLPPGCTFQVKDGEDHLGILRFNKFGLGKQSGHIPCTETHKCICQKHLKPLSDDFELKQGDTFSTLLEVKEVGKKTKLWDWSDVKVDGSKSKECSPEVVFKDMDPNCGDKTFEQDSPIMKCISTLENDAKIEYSVESNNKVYYLKLFFDTNKKLGHKTNCPRVGGKESNAGGAERRRRLLQVGNGGGS